MKFLQNILIKVIISLIRRGNAEQAMGIADYITAPHERGYYKGICLFEVGNLAEAENYLESALESRASKHMTTARAHDESIVQILAQVYMLQNKWDKAIKLLLPYKKQPITRRLFEIINKGDDSRRAYINYTALVKKAMGMMKKNEYEEAVICLQNALQYTEYIDDKAKIYNQIGAIYFNSINDRSKAEEYFNKAYQILPNDKRIKMNYAKAKLS